MTCEPRVGASVCVFMSLSWFVLELQTPGWHGLGCAVSNNVLACTGLYNGHLRDVVITQFHQEAVSRR